VEPLPVPDPPLLEVPIGLAMLVLVILVHGFSLRVIARRFSWAWSRVSVNTAHWRINLLLASVVGTLALVHLAETLIFAAPLYAFGVFDDMRDSYFYVLESYTTLGEGGLKLPDQWRLLGPIIAMAGLFTFGWTGSVLVSIMSQVGKFDTEQAHEAIKEQRAGATPEPR
jgi:hypothetical protein